MTASPRKWLVALLLLGCSEDIPSPGLQVVDGGGDAAQCLSVDDDAGDDDSCAPVCATEHPHSLGAVEHINEPWPASAYNSRPPSSGEHCNDWSAYGVAYSQARPLPACYFLHNLEHGAVALLYNCPEGCPEIVAELESILEAPPRDPDCPFSRLVLTPYSDMPTKVAAAAWGYTWTTDCFDEGSRASLIEFISTHQGSRGDAPEARVCSHGSLTP